MSQYRIPVGLRSFLTPSASLAGVVLPDPGQGLIQGHIEDETTTLDEAARKIVEAKNPTLFPGPLVLWKWNKESSRMAKAIKNLAHVAKMNIIPMADYRPKYPKIDPELEINPNHPNLTIWHNKIDVCLFVGVHCHYSNIALKIIRGGTDCYTIALCSFAGDEEAHLTIRDLTPETIDRLAEHVRKARSNFGASHQRKSLSGQLSGSL